MKKLFFFSALFHFFYLSFSQVTSDTRIYRDTLEAKRVEVINRLPDGSTFTDFSERNRKCQLLQLGISSGGENQGLLNFYDFPKSNIDNKSRVFFAIEDRDWHSRFRMVARTGGTSVFTVYDDEQKVAFSATATENDFLFVGLHKPNSTLAIGGNPVFPIKYKLIVHDGDSSLDGNLEVAGNIGIGTKDTKGYRLGVKGKVAAEEVKVALHTNWPDYVFDKEYDLPTLKEVEKHIQEKGHLENIPNAEEVTKNEGIFLGEINAKLLQKIEELTLYTIQQQKLIEALNIRLQNLEKE